MEFNAPTKYFDTIDMLRARSQLTLLEEVVEESSIELDDELKKIIGDYLREPFRNLDVYPGHYRSLWKISVINNGGEPAEDVVFDTPFVGRAQFDRGAERVKESELKGTVELGTVRPGVEIVVWLWACRPPVVYSREVLAISYASGVGEVRRSAVVWGWAKWYAVNHQKIIGTVVSLGIVLLIPWLGRRKFARQGVGPVEREGAQTS